MMRIRVPSPMYIPGSFLAPWSGDTRPTAELNANLTDTPPNPDRGNVWSEVLLGTRVRSRRQRRGR